jgi:hypothetical protein
MNEALRNQLLEMQADDSNTRRRLINKGKLYGPHLPKDYYNPQMAAVHKRNNAQMRAIIAEHGWPGKSLVGEDGSEAAWKLVQHAVLDPDIQEMCLPLLEAAVKVGEAEGQHLAMLTDRILMQKGEPQIYGSQFVGGEDGSLVPYTIADPEGVDERRASVGLPPLDEIKRQLQARVNLEKKVQESAKSEQVEKP